jgi:hypothetical protein
MAIIRFTQCNFNFVQDMHSKIATEMPILPRMKYYRQLLSTTPDNTFSTLDENFLLVAQWMKRKKLLLNLTFYSVCSCRQFSNGEWSIETDDDGDMLGDPHHGFFRQRLDYLR